MWSSAVKRVASAASLARGDRSLRRSPHRHEHGRNEDFGLDYAETLRRWRTNLEEHGGRLERLGYDERFRRLWRLYLCYCEAGFAERRIGVAQALFAKPAWRPQAAVSGSACRAA
jgi:hypothetical protein